MAPKQSSFVEGSMNDRVSAAPPPDFLDEGTSTADYERHFAMDWKPPELQFESGGHEPNGYNNGNVPGNRNSFMSAHSGMSTFTARNGATTNKAPRGLFGKVREKLNLHKSRSNWTVGGRDDDEAEAEAEAAAADEEDDIDRNTFLTSFPVPPVFKQKRSESMDTSTLDANNRFGNYNSTTQSATDFGMFQRDAAANNNNNNNNNSNNIARGSRPAPPARADSLGTALPSFDPTKRPTREEINANYQSLLATGFFGTHAIQSTRFSPPGAKNLRRAAAPSDLPSFAKRLEEDKNLDDDKETNQAGSSIIPPSPVRQAPPPPPPSREPPPPPPPEMELDMEDEEPASSTSTPTAIPASATVVYNPVPPPRTSSLDGGDTTMSPPPLPNPRTRKPPLAFSSVPYSSTRPGAEPTLTARPYRPPPSSLARFSVDSSRPRSLDVQQFARGTKRPFSSAGTNGSQTSFYTHRSSYDYDPMATDGHGGIGVATTTAEEKVESGARKLVKRLKKSASRLSFRSNQPAKFCGVEGNEEWEDGAELQQPPSRTSMSSTVRRSFSWRLGQLKPGTFSDSKEPNPFTSTSTSANKIFGGLKTTSGSDAFSLNRNSNSSMDHFQPPPPPVPTTRPPTPPHGLPSIAASPASADRNRLKKREIRSRRLRRKEESAETNNSPIKPMMDAAMDWQHPPSPTKRPRRSDASIFLRALDSSNAATAAAAATAVAADVDSDESDFEPDMPVPVPSSSGSGSSSGESLPPDAAGAGAGAAPCEGMEGVEFSFHFPGRMRPAAAAAAANGNHVGGPLAVVPDVNRGMPSVMGTTMGGFGAKKSGSVRVVRGDLA